jgi:pyruvate formate-lyase activating enzyme-like uncharacterized protein
MTQTVAVEIPAIPEDYETVRKLLPDMQKIGVRHLNLHQLYASEHNYRELARRGYTIAPSVEHGPVVFASEMTAFRRMAMNKRPRWETDSVSKTESV